MIIKIMMMMMITVFYYIVIVPTTLFSAVWQRPHTCCAKCDTMYWLIIWSEQWLNMYATLVMVDSAHCGDRRKSASCMSGWLAIHTSQVFVQVYMYMLVICTMVSFYNSYHQNALLCPFIFKLGYPKVWIAKATICTCTRSKTLKSSDW